MMIILIYTFTVSRAYLTYICIEEMLSVKLWKVLNTNLTTLLHV